MALTLVIGVLSFPFFVFLIQEYRDARGRRRNDVGRCYECRALMDPPIPVLHYHYRSPSTLHFYCAECANAEDRKGRIWVSILGIAVGATFAALALRESALSFWDAALFGAASALTVALFLFVLFKPRKSRARSGVEAGNLPARKTDTPLKKPDLKSPEEAEEWYRQKTIDDARAVRLPDGVFRIVLYNSRYSRRAPEKQIDLYEVFSSSPRDEVEDWIQRSKKLMSSNYEVGDALVGKLNGKSANYEAIRESYINSNPGFSGDTYTHAIRMGASKAVH